MTNAPRYKALREAETRSLDCERFVPSRENDRAAEPRKTRTAALFSWIPLTKGNKPDILQLCGKDSFYEELNREKAGKERPARIFEVFRIERVSEGFIGWRPFVSR